MAPTICSDKKLLHARNGRGGGGLTSLRRQSRILRRHQAPATSSIINYVSKGAFITDGTVAPFLLRPKTSNNVSSSGIGDRLQEEQKQSEVQNDQIMISSPSQPFAASEMSASIISRPASTSETVFTEAAAAAFDRRNRRCNDYSNYSRSRSSSRSRSRSYSRSRSRSLGRSSSRSSIRSISSFQDSENSFQNVGTSDFEFDDGDDDDDDDRDGYEIINADTEDMPLDKSRIHRSLGDTNERDDYQPTGSEVLNAPVLNEKDRDLQQRHSSVICKVTNNSTSITRDNRNRNSDNNNMNEQIHHIIHNRDIYSDLCEIKDSEGLLSIAIKTIRLVKRNQLLQRRLVQLQLETSEFIQSVLANPENRHLRENMQKRGESKQMQQEQEQEHQHQQHQLTKHQQTHQEQQDQQEKAEKEEKLNEQTQQI